MPTCSHWGNYRIETDGDQIIAVHPYDVDSDPTPIGQSLLNALDAEVRIAQPMVREGYLNDGWKNDGAGRGREPFIPVSWDVVLDLAAEALARTKKLHGNSSIYGGSYGWASAGRFHHSQGQLHRFLNGFGGYTYSVNSYSTAAAQVIMQHILAIDYSSMFLQAEWIACRPGSDVAIMLGIAYTLVHDNLHDQAFLDRYTVGFDRFLPYLLGESDGIPKDVEWASRLSGVPFDVIQDIAWRLAENRSVLAKPALMVDYCHSDRSTSGHPNGLARPVRIRSLAHPGREPVPETGPSSAADQRRLWSHSRGLVKSHRPRDPYHGLWFDLWQRPRC